VNHSVNGAVEMTAINGHGDDERACQGQAPTKATAALSGA